MAPEIHRLISAIFMYFLPLASFEYSPWRLAVTAVARTAAEKSFISKLFNYFYILVLSYYLPFYSDNSYLVIPLKFFILCSQKIIAPQTAPSTTTATFMMTSWHVGKIEIIRNIFKNNLLTLKGSLIPISIVVEHLIINLIGSIAIECS